MNNTFTLLEFNKILDMLATLAVSERARIKIRNLKPYSNIREIARHQEETTEARRLLEAIGTPPLAAMEELDKIMNILGKEAVLLPDQLTALAMFLATCRRMKQYLKRGEQISPVLSSFGMSIDPAQELEDEIDRCIRGGRVDDNASPELKDIRRQIESTRDRIKQKLSSLLRSHPEWFMESFTAERNGRQTLPVKKEYRHMVEGTVADSSQTGSTVFIEPAAVRKLQEELNYLLIREENEVLKVLYMLTALVEDYAQVIKINMEAMETLDFLFAKAKLSIEMKARLPGLTEERRIVINNGRHPLLNPKTVVPLKFAIGNGINAVIITGPNTGGKTVALKTVGLLSLMAQSGLHVPTDEESLFCVNSSVLCDIGDGQSIEQNLSTFSAHMTNIIRILNEADDKALVLLDELGAGTDPTEGMGLAIALLEEFKKRGCLLLATTHYPEIKEFADSTPGFCNARMSFDLNSLQPLYRLEIGIAGESCALHIAERLGLPKHIVERAHKVAYNKEAPSGKGVPSAEATPGNAYHDEVRQKKLQHEELFNIKGVSAHEKATPGLSHDEKPVKYNYKIGDSVRIRATGQIGIVFAPMDEKGNVGIQVHGKKIYMNYKRIRLYLPAEELYPDYPNYDMSIVLDTVANRKARKIMDKRHVEGNVIIYEDK